RLARGRGMVAHVAPNDRLCVRIGVEELSVDEGVVRARGLERGADKRDERDAEAARPEVPRRVLEGDPLVDGGPAGLGEGDAARLETHRLGRVLAVRTGGGKGAVV